LAFNQRVREFIVLVVYSDTQVAYFTDVLTDVWSILEIVSIFWKHFNCYFHRTKNRFIIR